MCISRSLGITRIREFLSRLGPQGSALVHVGSVRYLYLAQGGVVGSV